MLPYAFYDSILCLSCSNKKKEGKKFVIYNNGVAIKLKQHITTYAWCNGVEGTAFFSSVQDLGHWLFIILVC